MEYWNNYRAWVRPQSRNGSKLIAVAAIGGCFANPAETYPWLFSSHGLFAEFPYLLPNIICAFLLVVAISLGLFLIEETHPDKQPWSTPADLDASVAETPLLPAQGANSHAAANLTAASYGTFGDVDMHRDATWRVRSNGEWVEHRPMQEKVLSRPVIMFVAALGIFTYHSVSSTPRMMNIQALRNHPFHVR